MVCRKYAVFFITGGCRFSCFDGADSGTSRRTALSNTFKDSDDAGDCNLYNWKFIPIPFILLFIKQIFKWLKKTKLFCPLIEKLERRAMGKSDQIKRYEFWGLVLFVGIPLPGTGAWTGSLVASLLEVDLKKSVPAILLGLCMATVIMCIVGYGALGSILS